MTGVVQVEDAVLGRLLELSGLLAEGRARLQLSLGLSTPRARLVGELRRRGPVTQRTLSDALKVTTRTITGLVDGLVDTGFVTREPHPHDRRAALVTLTETGRQAASAMHAEQQRVARRLFGDFSEDELTELVDGLDRALGKLKDSF